MCLGNSAHFGVGVFAWEPLPHKKFTLVRLSLVVSVACGFCFHLWLSLNDKVGPHPGKEQAP